MHFHWLRADDSNPDDEMMMSAIEVADVERNVGYCITPTN
jgi:hypothetical protein